MSEADIESGRRWDDQIAAELDLADYGIICLTSANLERPWLNFEAGALAKQFNTARVVPLLIDLESADVTMPLASFQGRTLNKEGMRRLVQDVSASRENPMPRERVDSLFDATWPELKSSVDAAIKSAPAGPAAQRSQTDMLAELIETVRRLDRRWDTLEPPLSVEDVTFGEVLRRALRVENRTQSWLARELNSILAR